MSIYPSLEWLLDKAGPLADKNISLFEVRRSVRSLFVIILFFIALLAVVIFCNVKWPNANLLGFITPKVHVSMRWLSIIPTLVLLEIFRRYHNDLYLFSLHSLTHYSGRLSLNYAVTNIRFVDIRTVVVKQDIWGRMFDYGDIDLETSAQDEPEFSFYAIRDPEGLGELIEKQRQKSLSLAEAEDSSSPTQGIQHD